MIGLPTATRLWNRSVLYPQSTERWLLRAAGGVFVGLIGCGSLTLNSSAGHGPEASLTNLSNSQAVEFPHNDDEIQERIPIVPIFVLTDLASQDPSTRLRALGYSCPTHTMIPLGQVFEAMEDEDEAVRARAAVIIERQWAIEEYVMDLTFSMNKKRPRRADPQKAMMNGTGMLWPSRRSCVVLSESMTFHVEAVKQSRRSSS